MFDIKQFIESIKKLIRDSSLSNKATHDFILLFYANFEKTKLRVIELLGNKGIIEFINHKRWYDPESPLRQKLTEQPNATNINEQASLLVEMSQSVFDKEAYEKEIIEYSNDIADSYMKMKKKNDDFFKKYKKIRILIIIGIFIFSVILAFLTDYITNFREWINYIMSALIGHENSVKYRSVVQTVVSFLLGNYILGAIQRIIETKSYKAYYLNEMDKLDTLDSEFDIKVNKLCVDMKIDLQFIQKCFNDFAARRI